MTTSESIILGGQRVAVEVVGGMKQLLISLGSVFAGERNPDSANNSYLVTRHEHNAAHLSDGTGVKTISSAPCHLGGLYLNAALAGTLTLVGVADETGAAKSIVLPIGTPAGSYPFADARCEASLTAQKSSAADDGKVTIFTRPI